MCKYSFKNKITLNKHMNTEHKVHNCDKCCAQIKTSIKLLKHMAVSQERGMEDKLYYDECGFSCKTKKPFKHMLKSRIIIQKKK